MYCYSYTLIITEFQNSDTTTAANFAISSTASTNTIIITTHSITESTEHSTSSIISTVALTTTSTITIVSTSGGLNIATAANSTDTMFINSPTLSTSQSDDSIDFSSVGVIAVIVALVIVGFVIITVVVVGLVVVYRKRKKSKPYDEQDDVQSNSSIRGTSQRFSTHSLEPVDSETVEQDNEDHQYVNIPEGMQPSKQESRVPENVYSVPHCYIKMEPNPAYKPTNASSGTIRVSDVKYY